MVEEKTSKKKQLILAGIGLAFLLVLVIGATYAYFQFTSQNDFKGPSTIESGMGALGAGVTLTKAEDSTLTLNLSAADMLLENAQTYYASGSSTPKTIATVKVDGAGYFNCTYTLEVTKTAKSPETDMYERFQSEGYTNKSGGQVYFIINDTTYDFNTANLFDADGKLTYTGTLDAISSAEDINLTANIVISNNYYKDQTYLNGTDVSLSIRATQFDCELIDDKAAVANVSTAGVGIDNFAVEVDTGDIPGIQNYYYSINGGDYIVSTENTYEFTNLSENTEYEVSVYATNKDGFKSPIVTKTFSTLSTDNLANAVVGFNGDGEVDNPIFLSGDYTHATIVTDATYEMFYTTGSGSFSATSGTTVDNAFTYSNGTYTSVPENLTSDTYYHVKITVPSDGYYRVCYSLPSASDGYSGSNSIHLFNNVKYIYYYSLMSSVRNDCQDVGYVNASEYIKVVQTAYTEIAPISFYIQRADKTEEINPGYRYQGATPNNYVTFNGETWRIIGSVDGSEIGLTAGSNYTKIIRNEPIGNIPYDTDNNHEYDWSTTSLYKLLNGDYSNRLNSFANTGLTEESNKLIASANWYYTPADIYPERYATVSNWYIYERSDETKVVKSAVGIMYPSDYGYAASTEECENISLSHSEFGPCAQKNWLTASYPQVTITPFDFSAPVGTYVAFPVGPVFPGVLYAGFVANTALPIRPSVYLDTDVIITDGNGSSSSPYQIAKPTN